MNAIKFDPDQSRLLPAYGHKFLLNISFILLTKRLHFSSFEGVEIQIIEPGTSSTYIDDETIISLAGQFFNPLVNSNKYLREKNNGSQAIECQNGLIYVTNQVSILYLQGYQGLLPRKFC